MSWPRYMETDRYEVHIIDHLKGGEMVLHGGEIVMQQDANEDPPNTVLKLHQACVVENVLGPEQVEEVADILGMSVEEVRDAGRHQR